MACLESFARLFECAWVKGRVSRGLKSFELDIHRDHDMKGQRLTRVRRRDTMSLHFLGYRSHVQMLWILNSWIASGFTTEIPLWAPESDITPFP